MTEKGSNIYLACLYNSKQAASTYTAQGWTIEHWRNDLSQPSPEVLLLFPDDQGQFPLLPNSPLEQTDLVAVIPDTAPEVTWKNAIEKGLTHAYPEALIRNSSILERLLNRVSSAPSALSATSEKISPAPSFKSSEVEKLERENLRLRTLVENEHDAVMIFNTGGEITYCSKSVNRFLGYNSSELTGKNGYDLIHPDDVSLLHQRLEPLLDGREESVQSRHRSKNRDGSYSWVLATLRDERDTPGIEGVIAHFKNVQREEEAVQRLQEINDRFRYASRATMDVIWDWNVVKQHLEWGENFDQIFGLGASQHPTLDKWEKRIHPEDRLRISKEFRSLEKSDQDYWKSNYRFFRADGSIAQVTDRGYVVRNSEGETLRIIGVMRDVTQQKKDQERLRNQEEKFRNLFEESLVGVGMLALKDGHFLDVNQALINALGFTREELLQLTYFDLIPSSEHSQHSKAWEQFRQKGQFGPLQEEFLRKDREKSNVIISGFTAETDDKQQVGWLHILDMSPLEKTNLALQQVQQRFQYYIENASDTLIILNSDQSLQYISPNVEQLFGYSPTDLQDIDPVELIFPEDLENISEAFQKGLRELGSSHRIRFQLYHKNGPLVWVEANGRFMRDTDNQLQAHILLRRIETDAQQENRLNMLATVADKTTNAVIIADAQERIEWVNDSFTRNSGYSLQEVRGKTPADVVHGPESTTRYKNHILPLLQKGVPFQVETINYSKDGEKYWIESFVSPIYDSAGDLSHYIAIENNITQRKLDEIARSEALERSREQNKRMENFTRILSHNFRSYGTNILGLARELDYLEQSELGKELIDHLQNSAEQLLSALDNLSQVLKVQQDKDLPRQWIALRDVLQNIRQVLSREIKESGAYFKAHFSESLSINFYPPYIYSIFQNMLSNAIRYSHPDRSPRVDIYAEIRDDFLYLTFQDNGLGIDLEKHGEELFGMYKTFHNHPESNGLGLHLVKTQVESQKGTIEVESTVGKGTAFTIIIPHNPT